MYRRVILAGALVASAFATAPAAHAQPFCQRVVVSGVVNYAPPAICVPWNGDIVCETGTRGVPGVLMVFSQVCLPQLVGVPAPG